MYLPEPEFEIAARSRQSAVALETRSKLREKEVELWAKVLSLWPGWRRRCVRERPYARRMTTFDGPQVRWYAMCEGGSSIDVFLAGMIWYLD